MITLGEMIIKWAQERSPIGTDEGMKLLGLEDSPENYAAGNTFAAALTIIARLLKEKEEKK